MTDKEFKNELWIRAFIDQIGGYYPGHPGRTGFEPMVPQNLDENGKLDRETTLESPCYHKFTQFERVLLLDRGTDWRECLERARSTADEELSI